MDAATRERGQSEWHLWPSPMVGISAALGPDVEAVLLFSRRPDTELDELLAAVRLIRERGVPKAITVGSPHPAVAWVTQVRAAGAEQILVLERLDPVGERLAGERAAQVATELCPALQIRTESAVTVSVCADHHRLVLVHHHLERWCLHDGRGCPHRRAPQEPSRTAGTR
jgi:hypothetical protein